MIVLGRVTVWRIVAATDMTAVFAKPQVYPSAADLKTIFAAVGARSNLFDRGDVFAVFHRLMIHRV
jgi:hypothetical protein